MGKIIIILTFTLAYYAGFSQEGPGMQELSGSLEYQSETNAEATLPAEALESLASFSEDPLNINKATRSQLESLILLSDYQISHLEEYKKNFGDILSYQEILSIPGFNITILDQLRPFIILEDRANPYPEVIKKRSVKGDLLARISGVVDKFNSGADKTSPAATHLGSREKILVKAKFSVNSKFRFGILADKDAGEPFFKHAIPDSLRNRYKPGFDFYSAYLTAENLGMVKRIVIGDFHVQTGQGLTLWSSNQWNSTSHPSGIALRGAGIKPVTSSDENRFMRGVAVCLGLSGWRLGLFFSRMSRDGNITKLENGDPVEISSLQTGGYHRTVNEILDRNAVVMTNWGAYLKHSGSWYKAGISLINTSLDADYQKPIKPYNAFDWRGKRLFHLGGDWQVRAGRFTVLSGELAFMDMKKIALVNNIVVFLPNSELAFHGHYFSRGFDHLFNAPYRTSSSGPEWGIFAGILVHLKAHWSLTAQTDYARHPWLRFGKDKPGESIRFRISINHQLRSGALMNIVFRHIRNQENNNSGMEYIKSLSGTDSWKTTLNCRLSLSRAFVLKNRLDFNITRKSNHPETETGKMHGTAFSQDIVFRQDKFPLQATFRWTIFDTDTYESRIYQYEYDVLHAFSVPAYYGSGIRCYLVIKVKPARNMEFWAKASVNKYLQRLIQSQEIQEGNRDLYEIKFQMRVKL